MNFRNDGIGIILATISMVASFGDGDGTTYYLYRLQKLS